MDSIQSQGSLGADLVLRDEFNRGISRKVSIDVAPSRKRSAARLEMILGEIRARGADLLCECRRIARPPSSARVIIPERSLMRLGEPGGLQRPEIVPPWPPRSSPVRGPPFPVPSRTVPPVPRRTALPFTGTEERNAILPSRPRVAECRHDSSATKKLLTLVVVVARPSTTEGPVASRSLARSEYARARSR